MLIQHKTGIRLDKSDYNNSIRFIQVGKFQIKNNYIESDKDNLKKYNIIYADPPWDYGNTKNLNGEFWGIADKHYEVMKFKDICNLPVQNIVADDCYLFLWVTSPFLEKGFEVIKSWSSNMQQ